MRSASMPPRAPGVRHLVVVLGDQLEDQSAAFDGWDAAQDRVWMAEVSGESTHVWSHKARIALFLAAMRHFRDRLRDRGIPVDYHTLEEPGAPPSLGAALAAALERLRPERIVMVEPGEWRVEQALRQAADAAGVTLEVRPDRHFLCSREEFARWAGSRRQCRMEFFYREMRRRHRVLMEGDQPLGGTWNYDAENRESFGRSGPPPGPSPRSFQPDDVTRGVLTMVRHRFAQHPGGVDAFDWPVTRDQALAALEDFLQHRLPSFGQYQDAMWTDERADTGPGGSLPLPLTDDSTSPAARSVFLFHSRLSAALNLKLLNPREILAAAENAYRKGRAPLASVEGFIRQILGWREYVRGIYWHFMPGYRELNALEATAPLPGFYWTGETEMRCLRTVIQQTLEHGYAHHIQRLMVTGLFALLLGVQPMAVHEWYLAMYVDAVEWVELPNTLGMSQHADGGLMASKPYAASGKYLERMSNYCVGCRYRPGEALGSEACPFTTLYWDFMHRHQERLSRNPRMAMAFRNLNRMTPERRHALRTAADALRARWASPKA